jgi:hypothetical protein
MQGRMFIFCRVWYLISVGATDIARITDRLGMRLLQRWRCGLWPSRLWHHVVLHVFEPWRWKLYVALKRFEPRAGLYGITTQKAINGITKINVCPYVEKEQPFLMWTVLKCVFITRSYESVFPFTKRKFRNDERVWQHAVSIIYCRGSA